MINELFSEVSYNNKYEHFTFVYCYIIIVDYTLIKYVKCIKGTRIAFCPIVTL